LKTSNVFWDKNSKVSNLTCGGSSKSPNATF